MSEKIQFGKKSNINLTNLKGGLRKDQLKTDESRLIFDKLDTDNNNVLDDNEIRMFKDIDISKKGNKDDYLDKAEAEAFIKDNSITITNSKGKSKKLSPEEVIKFLQEVENNGQNIKSVKKDSDNSVIVEYNDGTKDIYGSDKSRTRVEIDKDGNTISTKYNGNLDGEEVVIAENGDKKTTTYEYDSSGNIISATEVIEIKETGYKETIKYTYNAEGEPVPSEIINELNDVKHTKSVIKCDEKGIKRTAVVTDNTGVTSEYVYSEDGEKSFIIKESVQLGNGITANTEYAYMDSGCIQKTTTSPNGKLEQILASDKEGNLIVLQERVISPDNTVTNLIYDNNKNTLIEEIKKDDNNVTINVYNFSKDENGIPQRKLKEQKKIVNGKKYPEFSYDGDSNTSSVLYDGKGNTYIIVQSGEDHNFSKLAKDFHCKPEDIKKLNKDADIQALNRKWNIDVYTPGSIIKVPGEIPADSPILQKRGDSNTERSKYEKYLRYLDKEEYKKTYHLKNLDNHGKVYTLNDNEYKLVGDSAARPGYALAELNETLVYLKNNGDGTYSEIEDFKAQTQLIFDMTEAKTQIGGKTYAPAGFLPEKDYGKYGAQIQAVIDSDGNILYVKDGKLVPQSDVTAYMVWNTNKCKCKSTFISRLEYLRDRLYVKVGNKLYLFTEDGQMYTDAAAKEFKQKVAKFVASELIAAANNEGLFGWNWPGTDEERMKVAAACILDPEIKDLVDAELRAKGCSSWLGTAWDSIEAIFKDELSGSELVTIGAVPISAGAYRPNDKVQVIAELADYGINNKHVNREALNNLYATITSPEERKAVDEALLNLKDNKNSFYNFGDSGHDYSKDGTKYGSVLLAADYNESMIKSDPISSWLGEENMQIASDIAISANTMIQSGGYAEGVDQEILNQIIKDSCFGIKDKYIQKGYSEEKANKAAKEVLHKGLQTLYVLQQIYGDKSLTYQQFVKDCTDENKLRGYVKQFTGQDDVEQFLAGRSTKSGKVNIDAFEAYNHSLYNETNHLSVQNIAIMRAKEKDDFSKIFECTDAETYALIESTLKTDFGGMTLKDAYDKALNNAKTAADKYIIQANAIISGQIKFSEQELIDCCIKFMHKIDSCKGDGGSTGYSAEDTNKAVKLETLLKAILLKHPDIVDKVKGRVNNEDFGYTIRHVSTSGGSVQAQPVNPDYYPTKDHYLNILDESYKIVDQSEFRDEKGNPIADANQIAELKQKNKEALNEFRLVVAELKRAWQMGKDAEGWLSDVANFFATYSGLGTDREDVENAYLAAQNLLYQLEAAAEGKLRDSNDNVISVQDLAKDLLAKNKSLAQTNKDYATSQAYWKMGLTLAPIIIVTTIVSYGTASAGWVAAACAAGGAATLTDLTINYSEIATSETGNTAANREQVAKNALTNGLITTLSFGSSAICRGASRLSTVEKLIVNVGADVGITEGVTQAITGESAGTPGLLLAGLGTSLGYLHGSKLPKNGPKNPNSLSDSPDARKALGLSEREPLTPNRIKDAYNTKVLELNKRYIDKTSLEYKAKLQELNLAKVDLDAVMAARVTLGSELPGFNGERVAPHTEMKISEIIVSDESYSQYLDRVFKDRPDLSNFKKQLLDINEHYGVKTILPENISQGGQAAILLYQELYRFKAAGIKKGEFPKCIDFSNPNLSKNQMSASYDSHGNAVSVNQLTNSAIKDRVTHEMTHALTPNIDGIAKSAFPKDFDVHNIAEDLLNNGVSKERILYGLSNPAEFLAVAAEGNVCKYSTSTKNMLKKMGMREELLNLKYSFNKSTGKYVEPVKPSPVEVRDLHEKIDNGDYVGNQARIREDGIHALPEESQPTAPVEDGKTIRTEESQPIAPVEDGKTIISAEDLRVFDVKEIYDEYFKGIDTDSTEGILTMKVLESYKLKGIDIDVRTIKAEVQSHIDYTEFVNNNCRQVKKARKDVEDARTKVNKLTNEYEQKKTKAEKTGKDKDIKLVSKAEEELDIAKQALSSAEKKLTDARFKITSDFIEVSKELKSKYNVPEDRLLACSEIVNDAKKVLNPEDFDALTDLLFDPRNNIFDMFGIKDPNCLFDALSYTANTAHPDLPTTYEKFSSILTKYFGVSTLPDVINKLNRPVGINYNYNRQYRLISREVTKKQEGNYGIYSLKYIINGQKVEVQYSYQGTNSRQVSATKAKVDAILAEQDKPFNEIIIPPEIQRCIPKGLNTRFDIKFMDLFGTNGKVELKIYNSDGSMSPHRLLGHYDAVSGDIIIDEILFGGLHSGFSGPRVSIRPRMR